MASKVNQSQTPKVFSVTVSSPADLRNVVLVGSAGSGKTTLFEQLLKARVPGYRGEKDDAERAAALTLASIATGKVVVNLLDAPGHSDFVGELRAGLRAADAAIFVVSAADGVDHATRALWQECASVGMPRAIVVTKLDTLRSDAEAGASGTTAEYDAAIEACRSLGEGIAPAYLPLKDASGEIIGNISLVTQNIHDYSSGQAATRDATPDEQALVEAYRGDFLEGVITESEDDDLMERYLGGEELAAEVVRADLLKAVAHGTFFPVVPVQVTNGVGVEELLSLVENGFPNPALHPLPTITNADGSDMLDVQCDPSEPLVAEVVRTTSDPYAGRQSMVRIFSGTLRTDDVVHVAGHRSIFTGGDAAPAKGSQHPEHDEDEKIGPLSFPAGVDLVTKPQAIAGDIVLVSKLTHAETSDTLSAKERPALVEPWNQPEPLLPVAIRATTRNDEDKLAGALQRLAVEDTTVRTERTQETDQLLLWTMGQAHTDLLLSRLTGRYGVKVDTEPVRVALRETFVAPATSTGRHVKQSGGHGQYAVCTITIEPLDRGAGFEFVDKVVGGAVPRQFIPSVEKGVRTQLEHGTISGHPVVDVRVTLSDGKAHSVDSSDMAFQSAGALAVKEAASPRTVSLLEPVDEVVITVGEEYLGQVMTDVSNRRGQVLGTDADEHHHAIVRALVPAAELSRYAIDLRGLAHGSGSFTRSFHGYELMPQNLADQHLTKE